VDRISIELVRDLDQQRNLVLVFFFYSIYLYNRSILRTISTSFEILNLMKTNEDNTNVT
jgi:hypothetical protein